VDINADLDSITDMSEQNCPNCGNALSIQFAQAKMATCDACGTTLYLRDNGFLNAGTAGEMHEGPMLFVLGDHVILNGDRFQTLGHARFDYGPGWWDEFYARDGNGLGAWISVDEGEVILQRDIDANMSGAPKTAPRLGQVFRVNGHDYRVTERDRRIFCG